MVKSVVKWIVAATCWAVRKNLHPSASFDHSMQHVLFHPLCITIMSLLSHSITFVSAPGESQQSIALVCFSI